jgi:hypothetical protein
MANSISHASLPYPVKHARYTVLVPFLDASGTPIDPTSLDTEVSQDNGSFADAAEEVTIATGGRGMGMLTLSGAETNNSAVGVWFGCATAKATLMTLYPRVLPILESGTAQTGGASSITLASGAITQDLRGCIVRTTGGTGGGGTGGAANQARVITAYNVLTKVATVEPAWEANPDSTTTYDVLITEMWTLASASIDGKTPAEALRIIGSTTGGKLSGAGTGTETFLGLDGSTTRVIATVDSSGNRTAISYP